MVSIELLLLLDVAKNTLSIFLAASAGVLAEEM